jgi:serine protease inhibitor
VRKSIISSLLAVSLGCLATVATRGQVPAPPEGSSGAAAPLAASTVAAAQAKLSLALMGKLAAADKTKPASEIITISPASLASVFTLLDWGSDRAMRGAMAEALGFGSSVPTPAVFAALRASREAWDKDNSGMIHAADKIILDPSVELYPIVRRGLESLGAQVAIDDLSKADAIARVNDWVKTVTQGMIPQILDGPLDKPAFVALNALHFKGRWQARFDPAQTKPAPFTGLDGKGTEVAMMHLPEGRYAFRTEGDHVGIELPFSGDRFSLVVVTTKDKPAKLAEFEKAAGWLAGEGFAERTGDLALPRMSLAGNEELLPALDEMGLAKARQSPTAFGGFAPGASLARIVQRAALELNEEGAEAAAATAVVTTRGFPDEPKVHMTVDKPFIYALRDRQTGLVVIAGYVGRAPQGKAS